jgi:hypothetical protein
VYSTTSNGTFWFCDENPTCNFICADNECYMFEKAITAWRCTEQPHARCRDHDKLAKMCVVKDLMKENYGRRILLRIFRILRIMARLGPVLQRTYVAMKQGTIQV